MGLSIQPPVYAQVNRLVLPEPGVMVHVSPSFLPAALRGITIHPDNALQFDFLVQRGEENLTGHNKEQEYRKLIKYFLASLTVPNEDQWVNLSPYEKNRIIPDDFGQTLMGRDLLAQDYFLKEMTSSLMYPQAALGKKFWQEVYEKAWKQYHTADIPINTFNKVWIVPDRAIIFESGNSAYILKSHLKVMLEEDYLSMIKHSTPTDLTASNQNVGASEVLRKIIIPELQKEINEGANFAQLRQMFSAMILATWYKQALKESLLGKVYADRAKVKGIDQNPRNNQMIYQRYLKAFQKGVFNYIKEDVDPDTHQSIPRKYFSGGFEPLKDMADFDSAMLGQSRVLVVTSKTLRELPSDILKPSSQDISALDKVTVRMDPARANAAMTAQQKRVVIVLDDEPFIISMLKRVMGSWKDLNLEILPATNEDDFKKLMQDRGHEVDLLITDTDRKDTDGNIMTPWIGIVKEALDQPNVKNRKIKMKIIVSTGADAEKAKEAWTKAGVVFDRFLDKPFENSKLKEDIESLLPPDIAKESPEATKESPDVAKEPQAATPPQTLQKKKVAILFDDHSPSLKLYKIILQRLYPNLELLSAKNEDEFKQVMQQRGRETDLLVMEINKRVKVAEEVWQQFEVNPEIKVIALSYEDTAEKDWKDAGLPMQEFLKKPYQPKQFENAVRRSLPPDAAMRVNDKLTHSPVAQGTRNGGIDFNAAHLNLQIKRDGRGFPLPLAQQDMKALMRISGFVPEIISIQSAGDVPIIGQLQHELQASRG